MDRQLHDSIFDGRFRLPSGTPADSRTKPTASARAHSVERRLKTLSVLGLGSLRGKRDRPELRTPRWLGPEFTHAVLLLRPRRLKYTVLVPGRHFMSVFDTREGSRLNLI